MPMGKGTYVSKKGRPKKPACKGLAKLPVSVQKKILKKKN